MLFHSTLINFLRFEQEWDAISQPPYQQSQQKGPPTCDQPISSQPLSPRRTPLSRTGSIKPPCAQVSSPAQSAPAQGCAPSSGMEALRAA